MEVISLAGMKISIPLSRFRVGATVPAWASSIPERLSPMILGSVQPPVRFEWDVDDPDIVDINGPFAQYGKNGYVFYRQVKLFTFLLMVTFMPMVLPPFPP